MFTEEKNKIYWGGNLLYEKYDTPASIKKKYAKLTRDEKDQLQLDLESVEPGSNISKKLATLLGLDFSNILRF